MHGSGVATVLPRRRRAGIPVPAIVRVRLRPIITAAIARLPDRVRLPRPITDGTAELI